MAGFDVFGTLAGENLVPEQTSQVAATEAGGSWWW